MLLRRIRKLEGLAKQLKREQCPGWLCYQVLPDTSESIELLQGLSPANNKNEPVEWSGDVESVNRGQTLFLSGVLRVLLVKPHCLPIGVYSQVAHARAKPLGKEELEKVLYEIVEQCNSNEEDDDGKRQEKI